MANWTDDDRAPGIQRHEHYHQGNVVLVLFAIAAIILGSGLAVGIAIYAAKVASPYPLIQVQGPIWTVVLERKSMPLPAPTAQPTSTATPPIQASATPVASPSA